MTGMNAPIDPRPGPTVNAGRLWAGGAATAAVAALIAIAGILLGRGLFDIDVLAPSGVTRPPGGTRSERRSARWPPPGSCTSCC